MKDVKLLFIIPLLFLAGCMQSINMNGIGDINSISNIEYTGYFYTAGTGERLRAVFLKNPESNVEIVPYSVQITTAVSTLDQARSFMEKTGIYDNINYQSVVYKGKTIGYLLTPGYHSFARESIEISLYERGDKVYFTVWRKAYD